MKKKGFTIIEVVLVLGIAGLVFMMVFIALPTLQRNSRDTRRREDMSTYGGAIKKYQINNRGALPEVPDSDREITVDGATAHANTSARANSWIGFYRDYLPNPFNDPTGSSYNLKIVKCGTTTGSCSEKTQSVLSKASSSEIGDTDAYVVTVVQAVCSGEQVVGSSNPRNVAIYYKLEGGGSYCESV